MKFFIFLFVLFQSLFLYSFSDCIVPANDRLKEIDSIGSDKLVIDGLEKKESSDFEGANYAFSKAIELDPTNFEAYLERALLKDATGDFTGAIQDYSKVIELNPSMVVAYINRGFIKWSLKIYYDAMNDFTEVIKKDPKNSDAYFYRGLIKHHLEQSDNGCSDLFKAKELGFDLSQEELENLCE